MSLEQYDYRTITYQVTKEFSRIQNDAFKNDQLLKAHFPANMRFDDESLPSIADYEELKARVENFERITEAFARHMYVSMRSDPRQKLFMLRNPSGPGYVAGAAWVLPKYLDLPRVGIFQQIKNWILSKWYAILNYFTFYRVPNPMQTTGFVQEFEWASETLGGNDTKERNDELHSMNLKQLKETAYPKDLSYYLHILAVRTDQHGKGYGKKIILSSLKELGEYKAPPTLVGPPKASLFSAPTARNFYVGLGFSIGASAERLLPNNEFASHTYFFLNLPKGKDSNETKNQPKKEARSEPKKEARSEPKNEPKNDPKNDPKSEPKSEPKKETKKETKKE